MPDATDSHPILRVIGLAKHFGGIRALDGLDLEAEAGRITAIIGPNGSGKTTFFNMLMHLYPATRGEIIFGDLGVNLLQFPTHRICRMGIARTFQTIRLFQGLTVLENVLVGMHGRLSSGFLGALARTKRVRIEERSAEAEAMEILRFFRHRLISMFNEPASSLSYANRRRLEIARAMAAKPKLILLDEPVAGMNPTETRELMGDIQRINESGFTVVLIEHDMTLVEGVAHKVIALDHGAKIAEGSFKEVCGNPEVIEAYLGKGHRRHD